METDKAKHSATVQPFRVRDPDESERLQTHASKTVGFAAVCTCGWRGGVRTIRTMAYQDAVSHRQAEDH